MFDIGFGELVLVFIIGLIVLGPQRLPVAVKTVVGWMRALRSLATTVQNELSQELKLQELQESLKKVEKASIDNLTPELKASMDELRHAAEAMKRSYTADDLEKESDHDHTIHNPLIKDVQEEHDGVTPSASAHQASAPQQTPVAAEAPENAPEPLVHTTVTSAKAASTSRQETPEPDSASPNPRNDKS